MTTRTKPQSKSALSPLEQRLETLAAENARLQLKLEEAEREKRAAIDAYIDLEKCIPVKDRPIVIEGFDADETAAKSELTIRYAHLAEALAMVLSHPDCPQGYPTLRTWWHAYFYTCGVAKLESNDVRDELPPNYKSEPFTKTALRCANALAAVFESDNLPMGVYSELAAFSDSAEDLLPDKYQLPAPQREAARVRALFTAYADASAHLK